MKRILLIKLLLFLAFPLWASPMDLIYDTPGDFWGKADASPTVSPSVTHTQFNMEQGLRFEHVKWLTWYGSFNWWEQGAVSRNSYWAYGIKNTTWFSPFILGIEEQGYLSGSTEVDKHLLVGYISTYASWGLKSGERE